MDVFVQGWRGEARLVTVWWVVPCFAILALIALFVTTSMLVPVEYATFNSITMGVSLLVFCVWFYVSAWRCAFNCNSQLWGYVARTVVCLTIVQPVLTAVELGLVLARSAG